MQFFIGFAALVASSLSNPHNHANHEFMYCSINSSEKERDSRDIYHMHMHQSTQITKFKHSYIIKFDIDFAYEMLLK